MPNDVTFEHADYAHFAKRAKTVEDVCENNVKARGDAYLPRPNPTDHSTKNKLRYEQYVKRAQFVNFTGYTLRGLVGTAFSKVPDLKRPDAISYIDTDIDGDGNSIFQQSQAVTSRVLAAGRHGLLVDYPQSETQPTQKEQREKNLRATVQSIAGINIINWKTARFGSTNKLSLVVIKDNQIEDTPDGFGVAVVQQYRALRLIDGIYTVELYRHDKEKNEWYLYDSFQPLNGKRQNWKEIPFTFVGAENNDPAVDMAPLYDMADVNIGHYRNSADYEEAVFMHGQGTFLIDIGEMSQDEFDKANPDGIMVGSRAGHVLGKGGKGQLLQMQANSSAAEAMDKKESQIINIGARIITPGSAVKTATEAQADNETEHSVLSLTTSNVSEAYMLCMEWMLEFENASGEVEYQIRQDFASPTATPQDFQAMLQGLMSGNYPMTEWFAWLKKVGRVDPEKSFEDFIDELGPAGGMPDLDEE